MRRPIRSITTLAAPVLILLALGCAKRSVSGPADAPGDAYAGSEDYASSPDYIENDDDDEAGAAQPAVDALTAARLPARANMAAGAPPVEAAKVAVSALPAPAPQTDGYNHIQENEFIAVADDSRSTFSIDVDTASYSNSRRFPREGQLPPTAAVRIEDACQRLRLRLRATSG